jgi:hypothetical protein
MCPMNSVNTTRVAAFAATLPPFPRQVKVLSYLQPFATAVDLLHARELVTEALLELLIARPLPGAEEQHITSKDLLATLDDNILRLLRAL